MRILINEVFAAFRLHYYILSSFDDISDFMMRFYICYPIHKPLILLVNFNHSIFPLLQISVRILAIPSNPTAFLADRPDTAVSISRVSFIIEILLPALNVISFILLYTFSYN